MDTTQSIIAGIVVVAVIALVVYGFRQRIGLSFKGWGIQARLNAKGDANPTGGRNVSIGGDAVGNQIVTGDNMVDKKPAVRAGRTVSIGRDAKGNTIVTGDGNKIS
jgi:hypothetical protein